MHTPLDVPFNGWLHRREYLYHCIKNLKQKYLIVNNQKSVQKHDQQHNNSLYARNERILLSDAPIKLSTTHHQRH